MSLNGIITMSFSALFEIPSKALTEFGEDAGPAKSSGGVTLIWIAS